MIRRFARLRSSVRISQNFVATMNYKTEQEAFWAGEFGNSYIDRNAIENSVHRRLALWTQVLRHIPRVDTMIEFGANIGINIRALRILVPQIEVSAIEINQAAVNELDQLSLEEVHHQSILDYHGEKSYDLSLVSGVLIHINSEYLPQVYDKLYKASSRYICLFEYYNPTPVEVVYRGERGKLFKRDFAGEMLDRFPDLELTAYGFAYHRDPHFPLDDVNWFLLQKKGRSLTLRHED
jgi:pseudaminic acid biosynthesis-associated methylase